MLTTPRLTLRAATIDDVAALHALFSDAGAMRYWSSLPHTTLDQTETWLASMIAAPSNGTTDFLIEQDGRVIGKAGCWRPWEIGFLLAPARWGRGLAREAVAAILAHIFDHNDVTAIDADVDPRNHASLALLTRLGFVESGRATATIRIGGEYCDSIYLRLTRPAA